MSNKAVGPNFLAKYFFLLSCDSNSLIWGAFFFKCNFCMKFFKVFESFLDSNTPSHMHRRYKFPLYKCHSLQSYIIYFFIWSVVKQAHQ